MLDRERMLALIQRSLGLKHKIKVHDSMPLPDTHEQLSLHWLARWELEDEINAIDEIIKELRTKNVDEKAAEIKKHGVKKKSKKL